MLPLGHLHVLVVAHLKHLCKLFFAQVMLFPVGLHTFGELVLKVFVGKFVCLGVFVSFERNLVRGLGRLNLLLDFLVDDGVLFCVEVLKEGNEQRVFNTLGNTSD